VSEVSEKFLLRYAEYKGRVPESVECAKTAGVFDENLVQKPGGRGKIVRVLLES